jgi:ubiquitin carboxyl-terminal hydrolase 4/11/15
MYEKIPVEISRDASFKELKNMIGRWMGTQPDNVSILLRRLGSFY